MEKPKRADYLNDERFSPGENEDLKQQNQPITQSFSPGENEDLSPHPPDEDKD